MLAVIKNNATFNNLLAFFAGCILPLSLSPFNYSPIIFPSIMLLFYSIETNTSIKLSAVRGYLYGLGCFSFGVTWIYISIHEHGNASPLLAGFLTMGLIMTVLAFLPALKLALYQYIKNKNAHINFLLLAPSLWVSIDWVQSWLFTGFPWLYAGYSQTNTVLAGFAPLVSIFGLTWLVVFLSGLLYLILKNLLIFVRNNFHQNSLNQVLIYLITFISFYIISASLSGIEWTTKMPNQERVVLVQGDIAQGKKWQKQEVQNTIDKYLNLSASYWNNNTIIWPETALPVPLQYIDNLVLELQQQAIKTNSTLITGIPAQANETPQYYNAIIALNKNYLNSPPVTQNVYYKTKLVPWGEYVPLENIFRGLIAFFDLPMSHFIRGQSGKILSSAFIDWVPFICYEIAYPNFVISHAHLGNALVTISNDAWFGNSIGPWQHLQLAQMRAIETGRPVVRSTNNGITAVIDHKGNIIKTIPQFTPGVLTAEISGYTGLTPVMYYGVNFIIGLCFLAVIICYSKRRCLFKANP